MCIIFLYIYISIYDNIIYTYISESVYIYKYEDLITLYIYIYTAFKCSEPVNVFRAGSSTKREPFFNPKTGLGFRYLFYLSRLWFQLTNVFVQTR